MTVFIVLNDVRYAVRDPLCIGRPCLSLGTRKISKHYLSFGREEILTGVCTKMCDKNCPSRLPNMEYKLRLENINLGMSVRQI